MMTQRSGNFFSRLKNVFIADADQQENLAATLTAEVNVEAETQVEEPVISYVRRFDPNQSVSEMEMPMRTVAVSAPHLQLPEEKDLDIRFATHFVDAGGQFIYCESIKEAVEGIRLLKAEHAWQHVFCWENEIKDAFVESNFQRNAIGFTIENSDAAVSLCETLIAEDGTILLNPKQASRRRLHCFPKTHIILTDVAHLSLSETDALNKFYKHYKGELPSIIKLGSCNNGHFYDKQRLILNAEGPENVYVFLVDQIIPPSLRP